MQRWGAHKSIWTQNIKKKSYEILRQNLNVDTVIVGAGITGLMTGIILQDAGKKTAIITDGEVGHGVTGSSTGHLTQVLEHDFRDLVSRFGEEKIKGVVDSCGDAIKYIEKLAAFEEIDCGFSRVPGFKFTESKNDLQNFDEEVELAQGFGMEATKLSDNPLPFLVAGALRFENQAMFNPLSFVLGLADKFVEAGGGLFENSRALNVEDEPIPKVNTKFGSISAKEIVLATHTPIGVYLSLHTRVAPYFSYVMGVRLKKAPKEGIYWDTSKPYFYFRPLQLGSDIWIIGGRDHKTGQEIKTHERYLEVEEYIHEHFDVGEKLFYWGNEIFESVDGLPYIGKIPFTKNIFTGTGYSGTGLTYGALAGKIISDLILGEKNDGAAIFDPARVNAVASATSFFRENINVAKWFVSDRLTHHEIGEIKLIAPNEGRVIDVGERKIAIYRNENGRIHALSSTCTHMGGTVHWNSAEKSWDCPCHGGRFRATGEALEGPLFADLEDVKLYTEENPDVADLTLENATPGFSPMPEQLLDI
jgi:glycine/D-amino acid oxidase-like deaminating enzyme/nitrite reductase/ring-hydroxylating ferredoxin subunit